MDATESVWQSVKPNKYCSCGYRCDCLQLIIKNKISTKRLFVRLGKENESDINLALSSNEINLDEILNQFNHFKYCKSYHSIFHDLKFNQIKRKPYSFYCPHHVDQLDITEKSTIFHQLIDNSEFTSSNLHLNDVENNIGELYINRGNLKEVDVPKLIHNNHHPESISNHQSKEDQAANENESLISNHDFIDLNKLNNLNNGYLETNSIDLKEIKCVDEELNVKLRNSLDNGSANNSTNHLVFKASIKTNDSKVNKSSNRVSRTKVKKTNNKENRKSLKECCNKFTSLRRYLNPFLCLLNILLILVDFVSDLLIARYHFISENYIACSVTMCFIYYAAYMHFLFETNFSKKLDILKKKFKFINLNNVSTDLVIGIVHLFLPVKIFIESIYLVYNMYKWELRLINLRTEDKHQDIEVALRVCLRRAHKSNLILALFKSFPQFLFQYCFYIYYLSDKESSLNWLFIITISSSLVTYIKNSYCGDLYYIEDNLNKHFEELRFLEIVKFNYLPFKFNIVLFIYNLTEFLLNFPFFLIFYKFKTFDSFIKIFQSYEVYVFLIYTFLFFKSYVTFFKNYLTTMKLEKDEDGNWVKDILFIRKRAYSHVNYLFILRLIISSIFLFSFYHQFNTRVYSLILFFYFMLFLITAVGYILKITIVADQLINLKNFFMWKSIFCHLENLNGFSIYNERLFNQWLEKILIDSYYFQFKILVYNCYHIFFKRN